ncbi:trehalose-phosphatase [Methanothermobacter sp.]|uniref:trehalose-phosphatase n=1 Tax=Methanothermobacter sp. TaxID=1884223 RepID=UPI00261B2C95|nr:trehalose-phosphatase [Methanothermobacter sp.]MDI9618865.1 trehalose-phosphatase [Methanothermobacter sp.]
MPEYLFEFLHELEYLKNPSRTAIITDIDGTISEIAPTPSEARVDEEMREVLRRISERYSLLAFISGRPVHEALRMVGVQDAIYVGNHGLEYIINGRYKRFREVEEYIPIIRKCALKLKEKSPDENIIFEDKGICYSIHYRQCTDPELTEKRIMDILREMSESRGIRVDHGRMLVELKPPVEYNKGFIVRKIIEESDVSSAVYLGDDVTDADAFRELRKLESERKIKTASIIVLSKEIPDEIKDSASFYVSGVPEVLRFLKWLLK